MLLYGTAQYHKEDTGMQRFYFVTLLIVLVGCSPPTANPTTSAEPADPPVVLTTEEAVEATATAPAAAAPITGSATTQRAAPVLVPTDTPQVADAIETDWLATVTVEGDFYILGNPNAPIRLVDYSDFL